MTASAIVWFQQDLRLTDNPALIAAARGGRAVIPVYIWAPEEEGEWPPGAASRWWLHRSLQALDTQLRALGSRLIFRRGDTLDTLETLVRRTGAEAVYWNRRYEPAAQAREQTVAKMLADAGVEALSANSALLIEPWEILNAGGKAFQVYGAFRRRALAALDPLPPARMPRSLAKPPRWPSSVSLDSLELLSAIPWHTKLDKVWQPGERGARARLKRFLGTRLVSYAVKRDFPAVAGTSRVSPHLHFGEIGPRQIWHALGPKRRTSRFLDELLWREFAYHLLHHFPQTTTQPLRPEFNFFPWRHDPRGLRAWQRGRTGVPLVDAGMRELWETGWMHNRVRMIVGSFLVKNLLLPWQEGVRWFWDTLVDADLANNTMNWQWVAGCGADASPFFRVFNPVTQARRYDPRGRYVKQWSSGELRSPIVDLKESRHAALEAYRFARERRRKENAERR